MMKTDLALKILADRRDDQIVVATYHAAFVWMSLDPSDLNYFSVGAMGQAVSHGLGLALGDPDRTVIVLDGDGSLLMNLGALVTVANVAPENLIHFVLHNRTYEVNGGHPIPGAGHLDFAGMARSAGYRNCFSFSDCSAFEQKVETIISNPGPTFVDLQIEPGAAYAMDYDALFSAERRQAFKAALVK